MARIPVEQRTGGAWWKWLLGLIIVGLLIWLLVAIIDTGPEEVAEEPLEDLEQPVEEPFVTEPVQDLEPVLQAASLEEYYGVDVQLDNMRVTNVVSDRTFYVEPVDFPTERDILVVLDEEIGAGPTPPPGTDVEGAVNVNEGQIVTLTGTLFEFTEEELTTLGVDAGIFEDEALNDQFYIRAESVDITQESAALGAY